MAFPPFCRSGISIHALREEGDFQRMSKTRTDIKFLSTPSARRATDPTLRRRHHRRISIHALREEGDTIDLDLFAGRFRFLSTPSARRATFVFFTA